MNSQPLRWRPAAWMLAATVLAGCASAPVSRPAPAEPADDLAVTPARPPPRGAAAFEERERDRALALAREGRLAEAAVAWEVLTVLRPDNTGYRDRLDETRRQADSDAAERLARARQLQKRGELDAATQQYLAALALQPANAAAADALRAVERERNKRSYLGKFSRVTLTRRAIADAEVPAGGAAGLTLPDRNEIEHASMLADQGEYDEAIRLLEKRLGASRGEPATRQLLSGVYLQKAQALMAGDVPGAIKALERSVQLDPSNSLAQARLKQIRPAATKPRAADAAASAAGRR